MPRKRGKAAAASEAVEKPVRRSHRASRARKSPTPDWEGSGEEEEVVSKPKRRGKQVTEDEDESDDSSQEEVAPVRRRRGRPSTVSVSESSDTAGGRKIRLRRTKAEPEMTPVAEQAAEEEPPPRRSRRTRQTRRGRSESGSEERAAAAADSGSPGEESRKKLAGRAANMSPIATKLSRTPSGHWLVCPSTTEPEEDDDDDEDQPLSKPSPEAQEQPASTTVDDSPPNVAVESIASEVTPSQPSPEPESPQVTQSKTPSSEETSPVTEVKATSKVHEPSPPTLQREEVCEQQESSDLPPPVLSSRADAKPEEDSSSSSSSSSGSSSSDESDTGSDEQANSASEASQPLPQEIAKSKPIAETTKPVESEPVVPVAEPDAAESEDIQEAQKAAQAILDITAESEAPPEESVGCAVVVVQEEVAQSPIMDVTPEKEDSIPEKTEMKQSEEKEIKEKCVEKEIEEQRVEKEQKEESAAQEIKAKIVEKEVEEKVIEQEAKIATEVEKSPEKHVQQEKITKVTPTKIEAVSDTKEPEQEKEKKNENVTTETEEKVKSPVSKKQDIHKPASEEPEKIVSVDSTHAKCETVAAIEVAPEDKPMPAEKTDESPAVSTDAKPATEEVSDTKEKEAASKDSSPELMDTVVAPVEVVETAKEIVSDDDEENESSDEVTAGKRQSEEARREQAKKRQHSRQLRSRDDSPSRRDREDSRKNRREEHSRQDKGSESRSTRDTRESRRKDRSGSPHRSERSSERSKEVSASTEKQLDTNKENTERGRDTPRSRDKSNDDRKEITLKRTSSPVRVEKPRSKEISRKSPSPSKPTTKPKRLEKLCLKRTRMDSVDDSATTPKTEGEGEKSAECATPTTLAKKRRWGSSQARTANKTPAVAISTEILKNIIPDAKPVPEDEVKQLLEEQEVKRESRGAEALEMLRQVDGDMEVTSPTDMTPMMPAAPVDPPAPPVVETEVLRGRTVRKISILQDDVRALQKSPSPPRHAPTSILHITNLVRPFTLPQLKELLTRTGNIVEGSFWIDKIKSKCFAEFSTEEEARNTRHALHGVRWPISNPKRLNVDYASRETLEKVLSQAEEEITTQKPEVQRVERVVTSNGTAPAGPHAQASEWTGAGPKREASRERERGGRDGEFKTKPFQTAADVEDRHGRRIKVDAPVREWDLHKVDQSDPHDRNRRNFEEHEKDFEDRRMRKRSHSSSPVRRVKKKSEEGAAKLLDDLFRKTKTTPCIYWLPLSPEQIAEKEEMRRQHMAEHERRMAEMKRSEEHRMMRMGHSKQFNSGSRRRERSPEPRRGGGSKPSSGGRPRRSSRSASPKK